jgi:hypothetical protein
MQPHELVLPLRKQSVATVVSLPQSQRQTQ